jgi:integrase
MGVLVRERTKGEWWLFISHHGRRKAKKIGRDGSLAREVAKRIEAKLALGEFDIEQEEKEKTPTFKEYAESWLSSYIKTLRRESTFDRYASLLRKHIYPTIGKTKIDKLKRSDIRDLLLALYKKGLSKSSVEIAHDVIGGPLGYALDAELIQNNPSRGILKHLNIQKDRREFDSFTPKEVNLFIQNCHEHFSEYYPFFLCAFRTGMRLGELLGLQWADVDWNGRFILVRRSINNRGKINPTKTGRSRRVDMSNQLFEALRALLTLRKKEGLKLGLGEAVEWVFHRSAKPMEQYFISRVFKRCLRASGLREIRLHDIRHSYASLLLSDGISPVYVKDQLGHASIRLTVDTYGHLIPNSNHGVVNRLDMQLDATQAQPKTAEMA